MGSTCAGGLWPHEAELAGPASAQPRELPRPLLQLTEALRSRGLTLRNYASIREQTVGGFTQVSAHGTGATIPPVDEQVVALKLVTPGLGTINLSEVRGRGAC